MANKTSKIVNELISKPIYTAHLQTLKYPRTKSPVVGIWSQIDFQKARGEQDRRSKVK